jgi:phage/plasmid-associated DNA primase
LEENYPTKSATNFAQGVLTWLKVKTGATSRPNPDGYINCTNGILEVKPGGHRRLISHDDPESLNYIFFDAPKFAYDPDADRTEALRLLECLPDPEGRALFMRAMAFAINWEEAARTHGHAIAVFSRGEGSNGKDTNIIMLKRIFGDSAVTGIQLTEFSKADKATSFALVELAKARLNLPSETNCQLKIDNLKTLKAVTSGNEIWVERKGEQGYSFAPKVVQMYPTNNEFILTNAREADERRYMGLDWPYSYTTNQHKLKTRPDQFRLADRRFLGHGRDDQWVCEKVVPGYFNILLEYFEDVCAKGFDDLMGYSREVLKKMYGSLNHLPDFIEEVGLYMDTQGPKYHEKSLSPDNLFTKYYQPWCAECGRAQELSEGLGGMFDQGKYRMITPESCSDKTWKSGLDLGKALTAMGFATGRINQAQADKLKLNRGLYFQFIHIKEGAS